MIAALILLSQCQRHSHNFSRCRASNVTQQDVLFAPLPGDFNVVQQGGASTFINSQPTPGGTPGAPLNFSDAFYAVYDLSAETNADHFLFRIVGNGNITGSYTVRLSNPVARCASSTASNW